MQLLRPAVDEFHHALAVELDAAVRTWLRPCHDSIDGGQPLIVKDMPTGQRWPMGSGGIRGWCRHQHEHPVPIQREISAALNIYSSDPEAFDDASVELATTFAAYAGVALANMHLYEARAVEFKISR